MQNTCATEGKRKIFYPVGLNETEEYLILTQKYLALDFFQGFTLIETQCFNFSIYFYNLILSYLYGHFSL